MQLSWKCKTLRSHCLPALPAQVWAQKLMRYQKTLLFSQRGLINKKVCAEKTSSSWMCSAMSALSSESLTTIRFGSYVS